MNPNPWPAFARFAAGVVGLMLLLIGCGATDDTDPAPRWSPAVDARGNINHLCTYLAGLTVADLDMLNVEGNLKVRSQYSGIPDDLERAVANIYRDLPDEPTRRANLLEGRKETAIARCRDAGWEG